jgi:flagellar biosynthetic protein FliS
MNLARAAATYKRTHIASSPARILEALLDRLLDDVGEARAAAEIGDVPRKHAAITHALRILAELTSALDHRTAPELCHNLASLYAFAEERLVLGGARMDPTLIDDAQDVVATIRTAFAEAIAER